MLRKYLPIIFSGILILLWPVLAFSQDPGVPDTVRVECLEIVGPSTQVTVEVSLYNDENLGAIILPLTFSHPSNQAICDSLHWGPRVTAKMPNMYAGQDTAHYIDTTNFKVNVWAVWFTEFPAGNGLIATLYFSIPSNWDSTVAVSIDSTWWPRNDIGVYLTTASLPPVDFIPVFYKGALEVKEVNTPAKPTVFSLSQNYPNPFNPKTFIRFALPRDSWVKMEIYNILGQRVKTLVDEKLTAGAKEVEWDGKDDKGFEVGSGIYFYKIKADDFSDIKKMVMLK